MWVLGTILVFSLISNGLLIKDAYDREDVIEGLGKELKVYRNKDGQQVARIEYLEQKDLKALLDIKTKDAQVVEMQQLVEKYRKELKKGGTATIIEGTTKVDTVTTEVIVKGDSIFPTYIGGIDLGEWVMARIEANRDSISLDLDIRNKYSVVFGKEKTGFLGLGKRKPFAEVTNHNPYSETSMIKTYSVTPPRPSRWGVGPLVGYGLTAGEEDPGLILGVGLSYHLFKF
jgi:ketosteroid isomerase-like protein